jgi:dTDP-4-amino-4,6-dideoxygalactose transaminase
MVKSILFNSPLLSRNGTNNLLKLNKLKHYSANGYFSKKCQHWLKKNIKCKSALLVHSCTAALEMSALLLNIKNQTLYIQL